jgi:hypothetical protein
MAEPPLVKGHGGLLIGVVVGGSVRFVPVDDLLHLGGKGFLEPAFLGLIYRSAGDGGGQDQADQPGRPAEYLLEGHLGAP